jgi:hypothetical protein
VKSGKQWLLGQAHTRQTESMRRLCGIRLGLTRGGTIAGAAFALIRPWGAQLPLAVRDSVQAQVQAALGSLTDAWRRPHRTVVPRPGIADVEHQGRTSAEHARVADAELHSAVDEACESWNDRWWRVHPVSGAISLTLLSRGVRAGTTSNATAASGKTVGLVSR